MLKACNQPECLLFNNGRYPIVKFQGNNTARIVVVGEPPNFNDTKSGYNFSGDGWAKMEIYLKHAGLTPDEVFFASICRCQINKKDMPVQKQRDSVVEICKKFVIQVIQKLQPKVVIVMGDAALKALTGKQGITKDHVHGKAFWSGEYNCWIFPVFGLGYIWRNEGKEYFVHRDFADLKVLIDSGYKNTEIEIKKPEMNFTELQSLREYYKGKMQTGIAVDTETQGLKWYNDPFVCLGYSICAGKEAAHWIQLFEETDKEHADFSIIQDRQIEESRRKVTTRIYVKRADNFEQKLKELKFIMESPEIPKFMHHGSFDIHAMQKALQIGGTLLNWTKAQRSLNVQGWVADTQFLAHVYDENILKLASLEKLQDFFLRKEFPYNYNKIFGDTHDKGDMLRICKNHKQDFVYYSCLSKDSKVFMADGSRKKISELVHSKSTEKVLSFNEITGRIEAMPIVGWVKKPHRSKEWYRIKYKCPGKNVYIKGTLIGPAFTPDHEILTDKGYVRIDALDPCTHRIATGDKALTAESIAILLGCLLGDGTLVSRNGQGCGFSFTQSENRKSFFDMIHAIFPESRVHKYKRKQRGGTDKNSLMLRFTSPYTKELTHLKESLSFVEGSQHLKLAITEDIWPLLSPASLAVWYFSDGTFQKGTEHTRIYRTTIANDVPEQQNIIAWLGYLGVSAHYHDGGISNKYIHIDASTRDRFFELIAPYATKDVLYKIPERYHNNTKKQLSLGCADHIYYAPFEAVVPWIPPNSIRGFATSYCLQIAENHNFLTDIGFVHNCSDAYITWMLAQKLLAWFRKPENKKLYNYIKEFGKASYLMLTEMETNGLLVDHAKVPEAQKEVASRQAALQEKIVQLMPPKVREKYIDDLRISRDVIMREAFYDKENGFGLPIKQVTSTSGAPSVGKDVRKLLMEEVTGTPLDFITAYHEYEKLDTIRTRYLKSLSSDFGTDGMLHSSLSLCNTDTGRSSSREPNMQNMPKRGGKDAADIRRLIIPPPGYEMLKADESQAELRWAAVLSGDEVMKDVFRKDGDIHVTTGERLAGKPWDQLSDADKKKYRQNAKPVNFGLLYMMSAKGFQLYAKLEYGLDLTIEQAERMIEIYFETYQMLPEYHQKTISFGEKYGYVETPFGRRRRLPELKSSDRQIRNEAQRKAVNVPIQGASSDLVILAGHEILKLGLPKKEIKLCMFIHDELVFIVKEGYGEKYAPIVKKAMEHPPLHKFGVKLDIPLRSDVSIGKNFYDCQEVKFDGYKYMGLKTED